MKKVKWTALSVLAAGASLLQIGGGCLNSFWQGFWNSGWTDNVWLRIAEDVLYEELFG